MSKNKSYSQNMAKKHQNETACTYNVENYNDKKTTKSRKKTMFSKLSRKVLKLKATHSDRLILH